ncbi:MAG: hypothetical protein C5B48_03715 [Candidatus Rokuibacteriota bacterium]|nr:MAG: hypothetical protein C5B48_03715 [Candidatus Rokubacteria bacterium]
MVRVVSRQARRHVVDIDFPTASSEADALRSALVWVARQRGVALADLQAEVVRRYPVPPSSELGHPVPALLGGEESGCDGR